MANEQKDTRSWPELAIGLYDQLTGRGAQISYEMEDLQVAVPSGVGSDADHATWKVNGTLKIRTQDNASKA